MSNGHEESNGIQLDATSQCCKCSMEKTVCALHKSWTELRDSLIEKDHSINTLSDRVSQLAVHETESKRKDGVISALRKEIVQLQKEVQEKSTSVSTLDTALDSKRHSLLQMETNIFKLNETIESLRTKSSQADKTISALKTQLAQKSESLAMKSDELKELKKGRRFVEDDLNCSIEGMKEKQATVNSLNERVKRLKAVNEELKSKLEQKELECGKLSAAERKMFDEASQLKQKSTCVSSQLNNTRKQLSRVNSTNDDLAVKVGLYKEQLDTLCHQLKSLIGLHTSTSNPTMEDINGIVSSVSHMVSCQLQLKQEINQKEQQLHETNERLLVLEGDTSSINTCLATIKLPITNSIPMDTILSGTLSMINQQDIVTDGGSMVKEGLLNLLTQLKHTYQQIRSVNDCVGECAAQEGKADEDIDTGRDDTVMSVQRVCAMFKDYKNKYTQLEERLKVIGEEQGGLVQSMLASLKKEHEKEIVDKVDQVREEERQCHEAMVEELRTNLTQEHGKERDEWREKLENEKRQCAEYERIIQEKDMKLEDQLKSIQQIRDDCERIKKERDNLKMKIEKLKKSMEDEHSVIEAHWKSQEQDHKRTIDQQNVQLQQHSRTIATLSDRLEKSIKDSQQMTKLNEDLQLQLRTVTEKLDNTETEISVKVKKSGSIIETLKRQLTLAHEESGKMRCEMFEAEQAIEEAKTSYQAKIDELQISHKAEMDELMKSFSTKDGDISKLSHKLSDLQGQLKAQKQMVEQVNKEKESLIGKLAELKHQQQRMTDSGDELEGEQGMPPSSLALIGQRCLGEQHNKVIRGQQQAIIDLRKRVDELLIDNPPVPAHHHALQELVELRQTVSQMKADEVIRQNRLEYEERQKKQQQLSSTSNDCIVPKDRVVSVHRLRDVEEALSQSEKAYDDLLNTVCERLHCTVPENSLVNSKKLSESNQLGRQHILKDREDFIKGPLVRAIRGISRRETAPAKATSEEVFKSLPESPPVTPDLTEYGVYPTKDIERIDSEKRLYQAINKRQEFRQGQHELIHRKSTHSCLMTPENTQHLIDTTKREYVQKLKKKDKEIIRLKKNLRESQQRNDVMASKIKLSIK